MDGYYAEIRMFSGNFAPRNWALCQGQKMSIDENRELFALIGTIYGGDGYVYFQLPDFRGRTPYGSGKGPKLPDNQLGEKKGWEKINIPLDCFPLHTHEITITPPEFSGKAIQKCYKGFGSGNTNPENRYPGPAPSTAPVYYDTESADMGPLNVELTKSGDYSLELAKSGKDETLSLMQPSLVVNFIICIDGYWPTRN